MSGRTWIVLGALFGGLGVAAGAFGAHGLKGFFEAHAGENLAQTYETAVRYQMYHALALVLTGVLAQGRANRYLNVAGCSFTFGIVAFSGMLYVLIFSDIKALGATLVPMGGVAMIIGWAALAMAVLRTPTVEGGS